MGKNLKVALLWPPLCERFGYYRFGPRINIMALGYLETFIKSIEKCDVEQINIDKLLHAETEIWRSMDKGGMLLDNSCIEDFINGKNVDEVEVYNEVYTYLWNMKEWKGYDLIAISYDLNYLRDRYAPAFFKFLHDINTEYGITITFGGLGFPSIEVLKFFKRFSFIKYMQFGNIDSINLETFKNIILSLRKEILPQEKLLNTYYRDEEGKVKVNFYKEKIKSSVESNYILRPTYHMKKDTLYRTKYEDLCKFDTGFVQYKSSDGIEIPIIPYRFSVGCVNNCAFCMSSADGKVFASKEPEAVVDDIERLMQENDSKYFMFLNSMINFSIPYLEKLHSAIVRRNIKMLFTDSAEFHGMSKDVLLMLKEMGAVGLWFGLECPSDKMLKYIHKNCTVKEAIETLQWSDELGIWNGVNLIVGLPHEKDDDILKSVKFIEETCCYVNMWQVTPFYLVKSKFLEMPDKYGIKIRDRYATVDKGEGDMVMATFDEIGGLSWECKQKKTAETFKLLLDTIDLHATIPNISNTSFLFYAYEKYNSNKSDIKKWLIENYQGKAPQIKVTGI